MNEVVASTIAETFGRGGTVEVKLEAASDLPLVCADASKLRRAVSELLENAASCSLSSSMRARAVRNPDADTAGLYTTSLHPVSPMTFSSDVATPWSSTSVATVGTPRSAKSSR